MRCAPPILALLASTILTGAVASQAAPLSGSPGVSGAAPGFGYPLTPFHQEHPIRAYLGEARTSFRGPPTRHTLMEGAGSFVFHNGVDIYAPNGTAVYPVMSGTVSSVRAFGVRVESGDGNGFAYWHIRPLVAVGQHVDAYETVLGHIFKPEMHVHLTEYLDGRVVNPLAPGASPRSRTRPGHRCARSRS